MAQTGQPSPWPPDRAGRGRGRPGAHPQVRERVVVARRDSSGENRLVAYVVPRDSVALRYGQLRDYLKPKLPAYMIPSALVVLDALPLTA
ncbi:MAG: hypothetical protein JO344_14075, partial [Planctomycetaceae bacterium]|nr:hypothetical protein [Planctomycetaceae bacterium]